MNAPSSEPLLDWGRAPALDAFETLMWRMDRYPNLRSAVVGLVMLDRATDPERVRAAHDWGTRAVPRLRERLVEIPLGRPEWVLDADFALDAHLRFLDLPAPGSQRQLLDLAAAFAMEPFDRTRSPWAALMVNGLEGGRAAYVLKLHHAMSDGIGIVQLLSFMFSRQRAPLIERRTLALPERPAAGPTDVASLLSRQARRELGKLPGRLREGFDRVRRFVGGPQRSRLSELAAYAASLRRALAPEMATPSPLLAGRNHQWRFEVLDVPLAPFKAAAKACADTVPAEQRVREAQAGPASAPTSLREDAVTRVRGATLNDAFVAGLLGGFARYHREMGVDVDEMPIGMPINIRKADASGGGNHFAPGQLVGPLGDLSPCERMNRIGEQVARLRHEPALAAPLALMPLLATMPADAVSKLMGPKMALNDLQCSNVPGIRDEVFIAGAQATHVYPFAPAPGVPAMITLVTHGSTCCIGMNLDSAAVTEPERLLRCMRESFDEIIGLKAG